MMKPGKLLFMVLVLLLGMAVAAPAVTIHSPWQARPHEANLYQILAAWGFPVDNDTLQYATPLESLPAGTYSIGHYALDLDKPQPQGNYHWPLTPPRRNDQPPADGIQLLIPKKPGTGECNITFTETSDFGFFEATQKQTILLTTQDQNSASSHYHRSSGLIFDLGEINPLYTGQYLIAFEAGRNRHHLGSLNGNSLVIQVHRLDDVSHVPLPGTLPLVGSGLLCLAIRWLYRRGFASAG
jgi:hypothetical protein